MPKPIQLSDARYARLVAAANAAGFVVKTGPGSQLGAFVEHMLDAVPPQIAGDSPAEVWTRWEAATRPQLNSLLTALAEQGKSVKIVFDAGAGIFSLEQKDF